MCRHTHISATHTSIGLICPAIVALDIHSLDEVDTRIFVLAIVSNPPGRAL
jgi:hypothetical protein